MGTGFEQRRKTKTQCRTTGAGLAGENTLGKMEDTLSKMASKTQESGLWKTRLCVQIWSLFRCVGFGKCGCLDDPLCATKLMWDARLLCWAAAPDSHPCENQAGAEPNPRGSTERPLTQHGPNLHEGDSVKAVCCCTTKGMPGRWAPRSNGRC